MPFPLLSYWPLQNRFHFPWSTGIRKIKKMFWLAWVSGSSLFSVLFSARDSCYSFIHFCMNSGFSILNILRGGSGHSVSSAKTFRITGIIVPVILSGSYGPLILCIIPLRRITSLPLSGNHGSEMSMAPLFSGFGCHWRVSHLK